MDHPHGPERIAEPLPELIEFARRRGAACLRLRATGARTVAQVGSERRDRRLLHGSQARNCIAALRDGAGLDPEADWAIGRLGCPGGPLTVELRRCLVGSRALVRLAPAPSEDELLPGLRRQIQDLLVATVEHRSERLLGRAGPEGALALRLAIESADLRSLVEAACDLSLLAASESDESARQLAQMGGNGLAALMESGQTEAAALLVRETRSLPRPETELSGDCRRLLVAPVLSSGVHLPERREPAPLR